MALVGCDVEMLLSLAAEFANCADSLEAQVLRVDMLAQRLTASWSGPDAVNFIEEWPEHRRRVIEMATWLERFVQQARNCASEQSMVSGY